jgi:hypothetical protein
MRCKICKCPIFTADCRVLEVCLDCLSIYYYDDCEKQVIADRHRQMVTEDSKIRVFRRPLGYRVNNSDGAA